MDKSNWLDRLIEVNEKDADAADGKIREVGGGRGGG